MSIGYRAKVSSGRVQNGVVGATSRTFHFLELTVAHKTVAEPY
jgi:hypothetical protein